MKDMKEKSHILEFHKIFLVEVGWGNLLGPGPKEIPPKSFISLIFFMIQKITSDWRYALGFKR
jgi:hypothetical protein